LNKAIAGDEDSTLLGQMKLARADSNDKLDRLRSSIDNYANTVAEANSKALIEALSEIIRDFNTKLNEQFGENFKQLNAAVEKLVIWQ
jgi:DNA anti-recombination protein RmuC